MSTLIWSIVLGSSESGAGGSADAAVEECRCVEAHCGATAFRACVLHGRELVAIEVDRDCNKSGCRAIKPAAPRDCRAPVGREARNRYLVRELPAFNVDGLDNILPSQNEHTGWQRM